MLIVPDGSSIFAQVVTYTRTGMRIRNRKAPEEKSSHISPISPRPIRVPNRSKRPSVPKSPRLLGRSESIHDSLPYLTDAVGSVEPVHNTRVYSSRDSLSGPSQSTPLAVPRHRTRLPSQITQLVSNKPPARPLSPLPPSSPPASSGDRIPGVLSLEVEELLEDEDKENFTAPSKPLIAQREQLSSEGSDEDPFGMLAVEKKLKAQREKEKRVPSTSSKGKQVAGASRQPLGIISFAPEVEEQEEELEAPSNSPLRDPTPYRSDDDDLYAELDPEDNKENLHSSDAHLDLPKQVGNGEMESRIPYIPSDTLPELPKTPHPSHVDKRRLPMSSPFSSRSTPCDRTLAVESTPSSPSPTKPLTTMQPLRHPNIKRIKYPPPNPSKGVTPSVVSPKRKADEVPPTAKKKARVTVRKNGKEEDRSEPAGKMESLVPQRPLRRSTRASTTAKENKGAASKAPKGKGKAKDVGVEGESEVGFMMEESSSEEEVIPPKKRGRPKGKQPAKKAKELSPAKATNGRRRGRPPKNAKPLSEKARGKQKAKANGGFDNFSDEDEVCLT